MIPYPMEHSMQNKWGGMVACSAENSGPVPKIIVISCSITVAASNIDRTFQSTVILGNGKTFQGSGINFSNLAHSKMYPLVSGDEVAAKFTSASEAGYLVWGYSHHIGKVYHIFMTGTPLPILPTVVPKYRTLPIVASFSSRGSSGLTEDILKVFFSARCHGTFSSNDIPTY